MSDLRQTLHEALQQAVCGDMTAAVKTLRRLADRRGDAVLSVAAVYFVDAALEHGSPIGLSAAIDESEPDMALVGRLADARRVGDVALVGLLPRVSIVAVLTWCAYRIVDRRQYERLKVDIPPVDDVDGKPRRRQPRRRQPSPPRPPTPPRPPGGWIQHFDPATDWADDQIAS